jgi:hypothetical protein
LTAAQNSTIQEAGVAAAIEVTLFIAVLILTPTWFGAGIGAVAALWWSTQHPAIQDVAAALFEAPFLRIGCQINGDAAMRRCGDAAMRRCGDAARTSLGHLDRWSSSLFSE